MLQSSSIDLLCGVIMLHWNLVSCPDPYSNMRREKGSGNIAYSELYQRNSIIADVDVNATYISLRKLFARALDMRNDDNAHSF